MSVRDRELFSTIRCEGVMLPASFLRRIAEKCDDIPGVKPADYYFKSTADLSEALSRAWNLARGRWKDFSSSRKAMGEAETLTTETREKWLLPMLQELGYGRLSPCPAKEIESKTYPISHQWNHLPIHLVGAGVPIDKASKGVRGAARISPSGLVQEYLNRCDDALWAFVSNGLTFRILRDNLSLTKASYIEFDLEGMMDGEVYSDFVVFWLLCHVSRVNATTAAESYLEQWTKASHEQGTRALDTLRDGVQRAIEELGKGFIAHPQNKDLKSSLADGTLKKDELYKELLRIVYRLIFLFVAEDREVLLAPSADKQAKERYSQYYSTKRLRAIASKVRGSKHTDHWQSLCLLFNALGSDEGCPSLGLPPLGSFLWSEAACPNLSKATVPNSYLLASLRELSLRTDSGTKRLVDFKNLGSEELGGIYESLLELVPEVNVSTEEFSLKVVGGNERKTTGSYYTPTSLITCLLDSALDPVLAEKCKDPDPEQAILSMKVCDPACGSGHFLIAAAHRIAARLSRIRSGDSEPSPDDMRNALRDVIGHCIYGVDINPMAVELCKVSLWLEALEPGKPLSFLEHKIQVGNALLGATPALLKKGIPDDAFEPLEGDVKKVCSELKRRNKQERRVDYSANRQSRQLTMFSQFDPWVTLGNLGNTFAALDAMSDQTAADIHSKQSYYEQCITGAGYLFGKFWADVWCSAFVCKKDNLKDFCITEEIFRRIEENPHDCAPEFREMVRDLANQYKFFHWHLSFPGVFKNDPSADLSATNTGWTGGFDVVLGNPPWERLKIQEKEWFASKSPKVAEASNKAERERLIKNLISENPALHQEFLKDLRQAEGESHFLRNSAKYPLCGRGDINTYTVFAETTRMIISSFGRVGCIVPSGVATDDTTKFFFQDLVETKSLVSLFDFENRRKIFGAVDSRVKFCLLTMAGANISIPAASFVFFAQDTADLQDDEKQFTLTKEDFELLNPNTKTCPIFRSKKDAEITKGIYRRVPILIKENDPNGNPWGIEFKRMFDMSNDSHLFKTKKQLSDDGYALEGNIFSKKDSRYLPLYEAKMIHHYDHRWATYDGEDTRDVTLTEKQNPNFVVMPRYWVEESEVKNKLLGKWEHGWLLLYRWISNATNERTFISSITPLVGLGNSAPAIFINDAQRQNILSLSSNVCSYAFDYIARQKLGGTNVTFGTVEQLPALSPCAFSESCKWSGKPESIGNWITTRTLMLIYVTDEFRSLAEHYGLSQSQYVWSEEERLHTRCELDAAFFILYGISREDVDYIMESFPIVKRKDEELYGEYRTKNEILKYYDEFLNAMNNNAVKPKPCKA